VKKIAVALGFLLILGFATPAAASHIVFAASDDRCEVRSWQITWGFKESFRSYLSGTIANGGWETAGNISYNTPYFTLTGTNGYLNTEGDRGQITGFGRIDFTGHDGFLDQRISSPQFVIETPSRGALYFSVRGDTQEGVSVDEANVRFAEVNIQRYSVDPGAGLWAVVSAPVVLTEEGATAFGTYLAGTLMDPIDIQMRVTPNCLERNNLVALWLVGLGSVVAVVMITRLVWRRIQERR
jgi:hypothetical protein